MLNFHFNGTRSGEWGDHVTLQAAADFVWFLAITFPFFELCHPSLMCCIKVLFNIYTCVCARAHLIPKHMGIMFTY